MARKKISIDTILTGARNLAARIMAGQPAEPETTERALPVSSIYEQAMQAAYTAYPNAWATDLYIEDDGSLFLILTQGGKLYRTRVNAGADGVSLEPWEEVEVEFNPRAQARTTIMRQGDGRVRWFSQSCTATLNRVGEIDGTELFDSFVANFESHPKPIRMFYHAGEGFKIGECDFVGRDGFVLITSGLFDDSELARRAIAAHEAEPDHWGESIGYDALAAPDMLEVAPGIRLPLYRSGVLREVSMLPEAHAAALFTRTSQEVERMLTTEAQFAQFVRLFGGDEAAARKWLEENPDATNRAISEGSIIARAQADPPADPPAPAPADLPAEPVPAAAAAPDLTRDDSAEDDEDEEEKKKKKKKPGDEDYDPNDEGEPGMRQAEPIIASADGRAAEDDDEATEIELTDETLQAMAPVLVPHILAAPEFAQLIDGFNELTAAVREMSRQQSESNMRAETTAATLQQQIDELGRDDNQRQREWMDDLPSGRRLSVTFRGLRNVAPATPANEPESFAHAAANTLDSLPAED